MKPSPIFFLLFFLLAVVPLLYGQYPSSVPPVQTIADGKVKVVLAGADSLMKRIGNYPP